MRAAVLCAVGKQLELMDLEAPRLGPGQVLVKLAYSGVCHSQVMEVRGRRGPDPYTPHLLGHEGSGRVEAVGNGVTKVKPNDLVVLGWIKGKGLEGGPVTYRGPDLVVNAGSVTTFNEYAVVSENRCVLLPPGLPMDIAVLFGCALPTGAGMVVNELNPPEGSTIAIFGLGGVGLSALMATMLYRCSLVIAVDISNDKLSEALKFGATHAVNAQVSGPAEEIRKLTNGRGVDFAIDASGRPEVTELAFDSIRRGGLCTFASHPAFGSRIRLDPYELICGKNIRGSWGGSTNPDTDVPRLASLLHEERFQLGRLISTRYSLHDINSAIDDLEAGHVNRPLIEIDPSIGNALSAARA